MAEGCGECQMLLQSSPCEHRKRERNSALNRRKAQNFNYSFCQVIFLQMFFNGAYHTILIIPIFHLRLSVKALFT